MKEMLKKYWLDFTTGTKTMFKEFFNKDTNKKQRANMWTFTRLITPLFTLIMSIIAIVTSSPILFISTAVIAGIGALTDKFDGASARKHKSYSEYGKILDQITDKSFAGIIGINLLFLNFNYIFILLGELAIALTNIYYRLKYEDLDMNSTLIGKIKQTPLFLSLALGYLSTISPTLMIISNISILLTVLSQLATTATYISVNNKGVRELIEKNTIEFIEKLDQQEENNLTKSIDSKTNKPLTREEHCEELRKFREELMKKDVENLKEINFQKTLKQKNDFN